MAMAVVMDFQGGTLAQYDEALRLMGFQREGGGPPGALFHWTAATPDGLRVVDVWRSREEFDRFAMEQMGPITQQAGFTSAPAMAFFDVYNYLTAG
jgi:hypothetical protein